MRVSHMYFEIPIIRKVLVEKKNKKTSKKVQQYTLSSVGLLAPSTNSWKNDNNNHTNTVILKYRAHNHGSPTFLPPHTVFAWSLILLRRLDHKWFDSNLRGRQNMHGVTCTRKALKHRCWLFEVLLKHVEKQTTAHVAHYCVFPPRNSFFCQQFK